MRVNVLYFGVLKEFAGTAGETLELDERACVSDALRFLRERTSKQEALWRSLAVAVNRVYAGPETMLEEGDELALLPPVSGGANTEVDGCE